MLRFSVIAAYLLLVAPGVWTQACPPDATPVPTSPVQIRNIVFRNASLLSAEEQHQLSSKLREEATSAIDGPAEAVSPADEDQGASNLADEFAERVREIYQNAGYFNVRLNGKSRRVNADPHPRHDILIGVIDAGQQYRLGNLNILDAPHFPAQQLRDLFPIQRGDIFSREKIANGLQDARALYGSQGYVNMTPVPHAAFDDASAVANLTIEVDEGKQFRLGSIDVLGIDDENKSRLLNELALQPGDVYTAAAFERTLRAFPYVALDDPEIVQKRLDERDARVDIVLDLRKPKPCQ